MDSAVLPVNSSGRFFALMQISGLHHITAICGDAQVNIDFYCKLLGLRLVKVTINFDDPQTYHLYYGDTVGSPGTALTFFAWPNLPRGKAGSSQATMFSFSVPPGSLKWWHQRLAAQNPTASGATAIRFADPDGILLEIVEVADERQPWLEGGIPGQYAITGFDSVTLSIGKMDATTGLLESMGYRIRSEEGEEFRSLAVGDGKPGGKVHLLMSGQRGTPGVGTVHHVAFATSSEATQAECSKELSELGFQPTSVQERQYFKSIYYREASGVLFEIATENPGFLIDEPIDSLGSRLCLPPWYEKFRGQIEEGLPKIVTPSGAHIPA